MSNDDPAMVTLRDALRVAVPVEDDEKVASRREHLVGVLEQEIVATPGRLRREQMRARLRRGLQLSAAAAGLFLALGTGLWFARSGPLGAGTQEARTIHPPGAPAVLAVPAPVLGDFETGEAETRDIKLSGNTELSLSQSTRLFVARNTAQDQSLRLSSGRVELTVPRAKQARQVSVSTPHATVFAGGSTLAVEVTTAYTHQETKSHEAPRTKVEVTTGFATIRHSGGEVKLSAGQTWLSPIEEPETPRARVPHSQAPRAQQKAKAAAESPASTLAEQNALLERALGAELRGEDKQAKRLISEFLSKYPNSPLRGSARAVKKRLD